MPRENSQKNLILNKKNCHWYALKYVTPNIDGIPFVQFEFGSIYACIVKHSVDLWTVNTLCVCGILISIFHVDIKMYE